MKANHGSAIIASLALAAAFGLGACSEPAPEPAPDAPGAATLAAGDRQLTLNWDAVDRATAYEVWYGTSSDPAGAARSGGDIEGTTHILNGLTVGTTYYVWLKAKNESGTSDFGPVASGNEGEWTLLRVSYSTREISLRRNFDSNVSAHFRTVSGDSVYNFGIFVEDVGAAVITMDSSGIDSANFTIGQQVRLYNGNDYGKFSNAVAIED